VTISASKTASKSSVSGMSEELFLSYAKRVGRFRRAWLRSATRDLHNTTLNEPHDHWPTESLPPAPEFAGDPDPKDWLPLERAIFRAWAKELEKYPDKPKRKKK